MTTEELLVAIVTSEAGYEIDLFATLYLRPLEDLTFAVGHNDDDKSKDWEKCFKDPMEAAKFFEETRKTMQLGYDFERVSGHFPLCSKCGCEVRGHGAYVNPPAHVLDIQCGPKK